MKKNYKFFLYLSIITVTAVLLLIWQIYQNFIILKKIKNLLPLSNIHNLYIKLYILIILLLLFVVSSIIIFLSLKKKSKNIDYQKKELIRMIDSQQKKLQYIADYVNEFEKINIELNEINKNINDILPNISINRIIDKLERERVYNLEEKEYEKIPNELYKVKNQIDDLLNMIQDNLNNLKNAIEENAKNSDLIEEKVQQINKTIYRIKKIINQTRLIAFNAAIESSRNVREGKGFSVIVSQIRSLVDEIKETTEEIEEVVNELENLSPKMVLLSEIILKKQHDSIEVADKFPGFLLYISSLFQEIDNLFTIIKNYKRNYTKLIEDLKKEEKDLDFQKKVSREYIEKQKILLEDMRHLLKNLKGEINL